MDIFSGNYKTYLFSEKDLTFNLLLSIHKCNDKTSVLMKKSYLWFVFLRLSACITQVFNIYEVCLSQRKLQGITDWEQERCVIASIVLSHHTEELNTTDTTEE